MKVLKGLLVIRGRKDRQDHKDLLGSNPGSTGPQGPTGQNAITGYLTNESIAVPANSSGTVSSWSGATGNFKVMNGNTEQTTGITFSKVSETGCTAAITSAGAYSVSEMSGDFGSAVFRAVYGGATIDKVMIIVKNKQGPTGATGSTGAAGKGISSTAVTYQAGLIFQPDGNSGWDPSLLFLLDNIYGPEQL